MLTKLAPANCERCNRALTQPATGRPRRFCSDQCRKSEWKDRTDAEWRAYFDRLAHELQPIREA